MPCLWRGQPRPHGAGRRGKTGNGNAGTRLDAAGRNRPAGAPRPSADDEPGGRSPGSRVVGLVPSSRPPLPKERCASDIGGTRPRRLQLRGQPGHRLHAKPHPVPSCLLAPATKDECLEPSSARIIGCGALVSNWPFLCGCHALALGRADAAACQRRRSACSGFGSCFTHLAKSTHTSAVMSAKE